MTREERKIYQIGVLVAAALIIAMVIVITEGCAKKAVYAASAVVDGQFVEETSGTAENSEIREDSAMPCVDREGFRRWYEEHRRNYEQTTVEEVRSDDIGANHEEAGTSEETQTEPATEMESAGPPLYRIAGQEIDASIQELLYQHLQANGIEYWYEGALCQMFQESHGQVYAENPNGLDKGLYQFRISYWDWSTGDIFDVDAQLSRYASEMAARFNAGLSVDEAISRHKTSDYCTAVDWLYVEHVRQWLPIMEAIR